MKVYGLIGKNIAHSFSKEYFTNRFSNTGAVDCIYNNFPLENINDFQRIISENPNIAGLNVTIPYKESIIPFLGSLSKKAKAIGAVNVIRFKKNGELKGYNSDYLGFKKALKPLLTEHHKKALILGTGGAAKAIAFALDELDLTYAFVSRNSKNSALIYERLNETVFENFQIIINCTPVGTSPKIDECPPIPYHFFSERHVAFDLIYNPNETEFMKQAKKKGAVVKNGHDMLVFQAEKSWEIWNK